MVKLEVGKRKLARLIILALSGLSAHQTLSGKIRKSDFRLINYFLTKIYNDKNLEKKEKAELKKAMKQINRQTERI